MEGVLAMAAVSYKAERAYAEWQLQEYLINADDGELLEGGIAAQ